MLVRSSALGNLWHFPVPKVFYSNLQAELIHGFPRKKEHVITGISILITIASIAGWMVCEGDFSSVIPKIAIILSCYK